MNKHTPTPWALNTDDIPPTIYAEVNQHCIAILDDSSGAYKFDDVATCEANAEHIVRCVNSHEALVKALETVKQYAGAHLYPELREFVDEALSSAGARQ